MDTRPRILIVEDIADMREAYLARFELEGAYQADGVQDLESARNAMTLKTYDVAVVDIMLAGEDELANRDGVKVVELLRDQGEGTIPIVVSAQKEVELVRDLWQEHGAYDYVPKEVVERDGTVVLLNAVRKALSASKRGEVEWEDIVAALAGGRLEREFVSAIQSKLDFRGGFGNLERTLVSVIQHFLPLLKLENDDGGVRFDPRDGGFRGTYWSKGAGRAVEVFIGGKRVTGAEPGDANPGRVLMERTRGGLQVVVSAADEYLRDAFVLTAREAQGSA
jgi:CheY-like chemotaxis protein